MDAAPDRAAQPRLAFLLAVRAEVRSRRSRADRVDVLRELHQDLNAVSQVAKSAMQQLLAVEHSTSGNAESDLASFATRLTAMADEPSKRPGPPSPPPEQAVIAAPSRALVRHVAAVLTSSGATSERVHQLNLLQTQCWLLQRVVRIAAVKVEKGALPSVGLAVDPSKSLLDVGVDLAAVAAVRALAEGGRYTPPQALPEGAPRLLVTALPLIEQSVHEVLALPTAPGGTPTSAGSQPTVPVAAPTAQPPAGGRGKA